MFRRPLQRPAAMPAYVGAAALALAMALTVPATAQTSGGGTSGGGLSSPGSTTGGTTGSTLGADPTPGTGPAPGVGGTPDQPGQLTTPSNRLRGPGETRDFVPDLIEPSRKTQQSPTERVREGQNPAGTPVGPQRGPDLLAPGGTPVERLPSGGMDQTMNQRESASGGSASGGATAQRAEPGCAESWDPATHMSREEFERACERTYKKDYRPK